MNIAKLFQGSLPVVLIHLTVIGAAQASDSMPSIQAMYDSTRPQAVRKVTVSSIEPVVAETAPTAAKTAATPAKTAPTVARTTPIVAKAAPTLIKAAPVVAKKIKVAPKKTVTEPLTIVAEWPTYYSDDLGGKKDPARPAKTGKSVAVATKPQPAKLKAPEIKPVVAKAVSKPVIAKADTASQRDPSTAKKLDLSKISIFGPQSGSYRYDSRMVRAMEIASARAYGHSQGSCWRYVKNALLTAGLVDSRPTTAYAKQAAGELTSKYGFRRIACTDPYSAPIGSVLVYGGSGAGHVEFRTRSGFVSDFTTPRPSKRPLIGVYVK